MRIAFRTAELACEARQVADREVDGGLEMLLQGCFVFERSITVFASRWLRLRLVRPLDMDLVSEVVIESYVIFEVLVAVTAAELSGVLS